MTANTINDFEWCVDWTEDGGEWHRRWFASLDDAREFGNGLVSDNESNERFWISAQRLRLVSTCDFLDSCIPAGAVRLA